MDNSQLCRPELLWTTRCTIARGRRAEGDSASGRPHAVPSAIDLTFDDRRHEIHEAVLLPNNCKTVYIMQKKASVTSDVT